MTNGFRRGVAFVGVVLRACGFLHGLRYRFHDSYEVHDSVA